MSNATPIPRRVRCVMRAASRSQRMQEQPAPPSTSPSGAGKGQVMTNETSQPAMARVESSRQNPAPSAVDNRIAARQWIEAFNARDDDREAEARPADYVAHAPASTESGSEPGADASRRPRPSIALGWSNPRMPRCHRWDTNPRAVAEGLSRRGYRRMRVGVDRGRGVLPHTHRPPAMSASSVTGTTRIALDCPPPSPLNICRTAAKAGFGCRSASTIP